MITIAFKSIPENWIKEFTGIKPNTFRFTDDWDRDRWENYNRATHIRIENTETKDVFRRKIIDKTQYKNVVGISWRDE